MDEQIVFKSGSRRLVPGHDAVEFIGTRGNADIRFRISREVLNDLCASSDTGPALLFRFDDVEEPIRNVAQRKANVVGNPSGGVIMLRTEDFFG